MITNADGSAIASLSFRTVRPGAESAPVGLAFVNDSANSLPDVALSVVAVEGDAHTFVRFSVTQDGSYAPTLNLGATAVNESKPFFVKVVVPTGAAPRQGEDFLIEAVGG